MHRKELFGCAMKIVASTNAGGLHAGLRFTLAKSDITNLWRTVEKRIVQGCTVNRLCLHVQYVHAAHLGQESCTIRREGSIVMFMIFSAADVVAYRPFFTTTLTSPHDIRLPIHTDLTQNRSTKACDVYGMCTYTCAMCSCFPKDQWRG